jgi:exodeoxyribonuclease-5
MVVDRIDDIAGKRVIIDYKTGRSIDTRNWAEERISEPQLPIYAALVGGVAGVAFAKVLPDAPAFAGIAAEPGLLPGVRGLGEDKQKTFDHERFPDWPALVAHWDARLRAIAREVKDGVAGVAFADEKALQYCEVLPALRLAERRRLLAAAQAAAAPLPP